MKQTLICTRNVEELTIFIFENATSDLHFRRSTSNLPFLTQSTMSESLDQQAASRVLEASASRQDEEYVRIKEQHDLTKAAMDGRLVLAPVDAMRGTLRFLDSATGDGTWLVDVTAEYPSAILVGADVNPAHFARLPNLPPNLSFTNQSVLDDWPAAFASSFDLVHQRFLLAMFTPDVSAGVVARLLRLAKPGGFVQLVEAETMRFDAGPGHDAFGRLNVFIERALENNGMNPRPAESLVTWLCEAGAVDVQEQRFAYGLGVAADGPARAAKSSANILAMLDILAVIGSSLFPSLSHLLLSTFFPLLLVLIFTPFLHSNSLRVLIRN